MNNKTKVNIGFDIGIASVGWAIVNNETDEIIKYGARLFDTVDSPKDSSLLNKTRRDARSARRQVNRRKTLRRDFIKTLINHTLISADGLDVNKSNINQLFVEKYIHPLRRNMIDIRLDAIKKTISKDEMIGLLYWYINHRGYKYKTADEKNNKDDKDISVEGVNANDLPVIKQKKVLDLGKLNGSFNRSIHQNEYLKELENHIFEVNNWLSSDFKHDFLKLFTRQRSFELGPGNSKTATPYGIFHMVNGQVEKVYENIWQKTIGKCSYDGESDRAIKSSPTSEVFNLINDLSNLRIHNERISPKDIIEIIDISLKTKSNVKKATTYLMNSFNLDEDNEGSEIKGFRINKKGERQLTSLENTIDISKALGIDAKSELFKSLSEKEGTFINEENVFDKLVLAFSQTKRIDKREEVIAKYASNSQDPKVIKKIIDKPFSSNHSFSEKTMRAMIPDLVEHVINQMEWINKHPNSKSNNQKKDIKQWNEVIDNAVISPTSKRSFRQAVKVFSAILQYLKDNNMEINHIVIEMARESNNSDKRKSLIESQKYFEEQSELIKQKTGKSEISNRLKEKIFYWLQQKHLDAYDGKPIDFDDLIRNSHMYDVDHIIPQAHSFDNSRQNKVLTKQQNNHKKSGRTPYQYMTNSFGKDHFEKMRKLWWDWYVINPADNSRAFKDSQKFDFLITEQDTSKPETHVGFLQRNLVDTRITTKFFLDLLNNIKDEYGFKTVAINGKMTSFARKVIGFKNLHLPDDIPVDEERKNRIWHGHHAQDAYLITIVDKYFKDSKYIEKLLSSPVRYNKLASDPEFADNTIERIGNSSEKGNQLKNRYKQMKEAFKMAGDELNSKMNEVMFSRMRIVKHNTKLSSETLYSGKWEFDKNGNKIGIRKIESKNLEELELKKAKILFSDDKAKREKTLIEDNDPRRYEQLKQIFLDNSDLKMPFSNIGSSLNSFPKKIKFYKTGQSSIKDPNTIIIPSGHKSNDKVSFYENVNWVRLDIYKNRKGKLEVIPITTSNAKFIYDHNKNKSRIEVIESKINKWKEMKNIDPNEKVKHCLFKGDILSDGNVEYYVVGNMHKSRALEVKYLHKMIPSSSKERPFPTLNSALLNFKIVKKSILGKIKKELNLH